MCRLGLAWFGKVGLLINCVDGHVVCRLGVNWFGKNGWMYVMVGVVFCNCHRVIDTSGCVHLDVLPEWGDCYDEQQRYGNSLNPYQQIRHWNMKKSEFTNSHVKHASIHILDRLVAILNQGSGSTHATLKMMIHSQLTHYIFSTVDMNKATSMILWHYWNALTVHPSYVHKNKCIYSCFTLTITLFRSNIRTNITQCFNYSMTITKRHTHHDMYSTIPTEPVYSQPAHPTANNTGNQ